MALVRCTCISDLREDLETGRIVQVVTVLDPDCGYVMHRIDPVPTPTEETP